MKVTLDYLEFRSLVSTACKIMEASDIGRDIITSEQGPVFWLRANADDLTLSLDTAAKGLELHVQCPLTECEEAGEIAINPFLLKRMSLKTKDVKISTDGPKLMLKAGAFKTELAAVQGVKQTHYDVVELSHKIPAKPLIDSLSATAIEGSKEGQPFSRLVWSDQGIRLWTHNSYNAAYSFMLDEEAEQRLDCIVPVNLLRSVADSAPKQDLHIGIHHNVLRFKNEIVDVSHPVHTEMELEDIEQVISGVDKDSIPTLEINPMKFAEALLAVGSVDRQTAGTPQSGVDIWVVTPKNRLILSIKTSVGQSTHRIDLESHQNLEDEHQIRLNHKQLLDFVGRSKGTKLKMGLLKDRTILWAGTTTYVLAPVQEDVADV